MILVTLTLAVALVVVVVAFGGLLLNLERRHWREMSNMHDRLAHAHGRTWTPAPVEEEPGVLERELALVEPEQEEWT
jgi:hypothetical protein